MPWWHCTALISPSFSSVDIFFSALSILDKIKSFVIIDSMKPSGSSGSFVKGEDLKYFYCQI